MACIIDAHAHIVPGNILNQTYARIGTRQLPFGLRDTCDGSFYVMPPYMEDSSFSADALISLMDVCGVQAAVLQQAHLFPFNEEVAKAVEKYPDRLAASMVITADEGWEEEMEYWHSRGLHSLKFEMRSYTYEGLFPDMRYDSPVFLAMLEKAAKLSLTVTIDPAPVNFPVYQPKALREAAESLPDLKIVICHLAYPLPVDTLENRKKWEEMAAIAELDNCWLDVSAMPDFFDEEGWPFPTALSLFREVVSHVGIEKLLWGSDVPGTLNRATYPQMINMWKRAGLSEADLSKLLGENALSVYDLPVKAQEKK